VTVAVLTAALTTAGIAALAAARLRPAAGGTAAGPGHPVHQVQAGVVRRPSPAATTSAAGTGRPLAGEVVGIDPGHNGGNGADPSYIDHLIWNGREPETCDTTGTQTAAGYTEARFTFNVAMDLRAELRRAGARVVLTRAGNDGAGPCVNRRAEILDAAHADVAIDIHADGGPAWGRGFTVLEPVADGPNDTVTGSSERFGADVRREMLGATPMPVSDYYGRDGIRFRDDLAGLNLTTVPKVLIECGNMRNAVDARLLASRSFQQRLAGALAAAITGFLAHG
jgi:N-acetylmuramoyl-L-alanine amidase